MAPPFTFVSTRVNTARPSSIFIIAEGLYSYYFPLKKSNISLCLQVDLQRTTQDEYCRSCVFQSGAHDSTTGANHRTTLYRHAQSNFWTDYFAHPCIIHPPRGSHRNSGSSLYYVQSSDIQLSASPRVARHLVRFPCVGRGRNFLARISPASD